MTSIAATGHASAPSASFDPESAEPLVSIRDLDIGFSHPRPAVSGLDLDISRGEIHALVGESGSGKSMTARALIGLLPSGAHATGSIRVGGVEVIGAAGSTLAGVRGSTIGLIFQEPQSALNPVRTVGWQLAEALRAHEKLSRQAARRRAVELLQLVEFPDPESRLRSYPHQLSGGQKQRIAIALALAAEPEVLIADEPTTALDVTVQKEILDLLARLGSERGLAVLLITHDMGVVANYADRVTVLLRGQIVETGDLHSVFASPRDAYTRSLLDAVPRLRAYSDSPDPEPATAEPGEVPAFLADGVDVTFGRGTTAVHALRGISLTVQPGKTLALVGESGSGKTTLGRVAAGLITPSAGVARLGGADPRTPSGRAGRQRPTIAIVPQDPVASLNPRQSVGDSIREPLDIHRSGSRRSRGERVSELLDAVDLPSDFAYRYPAELSGGQRQRVALARALALTPELVVADEPTSALDVSVQAEIVTLLSQAQDNLGFACIFITHDLALVDGVADDVAVLRRGELLEFGTVADVLGAPKSDYTRALLDAVPTIDGRAGAVGETPTKENA